MTKVKVFVYGRRQQQRRRRQQRRGYDNSSPDFSHGELKIRVCVEHGMQFYLQHKRVLTRCHMHTFLFLGLDVKLFIVNIFRLQSVIFQRYKSSFHLASLNKLIRLVI